MNHFVFRVLGIVLVVVINSELGASIAYGGDCSGGGSCTDSDNACIDDTCACATTHFRNNANDACVTKIGFGVACENAVTATDQCAAANQECSLETGTSYKCLCTANYYSDGSACQARKNPDVTCSATGQCVTNAECDVGGTGKCECNTGYTETPTNTPTTCSSGVVKFASLSYMYVVPILVSMMFLLR